MFVLVAILALLETRGVSSTRWDQLVEEFYPSTCTKGDIFDVGCDMKVNPESITQADFDLCIKQGERLAKTATQLNNLHPKRTFASPAQKLFFTSNLTPEVQSSLYHSKAALFAAKILQNKMNTRNEITPNTFVAFLEGIKLKVPEQMRSPLCLRIKERSYDGSCNNLIRPSWGAANTPFTRIAPSHYEDGLYGMPLSKSGRSLPSPRLISSRLFYDKHAEQGILTNLAVHWGQFVAHDLSLRAVEQSGSGGVQCCTADGSGFLAESETHPACAPIRVPQEDHFYGPLNVKCLNYVRSVTAMPADGLVGPAQQINTVSSYLDASPIYSNKLSKTISMRTYLNGKLKLTPKRFLPSVTNPSESCDCGKQFSTCPCYSAGDDRVNQTPLLAALQTLWVREHNRLAEMLHMINPYWTDERIFQETRKIVIAQVQHITYNEWLPACIGEEYAKHNRILPVGLYSYDHDPNVNPSIINSFTTGAFRFFHTLISPHFLMCSTENLGESKMRLSDHFFRPEVLEMYTNGFDAVLRGSIMQSAMGADASFTAEVTNFLFKSGNESGLDLVALDIQRGRDHGLGKYNTFRSICGLKKANNFYELENEIPKNRIEALKQLYEDVDDIDLFVGGTMETNVDNSMLGPTFQCIIGEQFYRTRVGDRHFYDIADMEHSFSANQLKEIKRASMARIICDNSENIEKVQRKVFQLTGDDNPLHYCYDTVKIPSINLMHWKE